jgi:hypothetical protein
MELPVCLNQFPAKHFSLFVNGMNQTGKTAHIPCTQLALVRQMFVRQMLESFDCWFKRPFIVLEAVNEDGFLCCKRGFCQPDAVGKGTFVLRIGRKDVGKHVIIWFAIIA